MNETEFERRLDEVPVVLDVWSLPEPLRRAALADGALLRRVEERARLDRLLGEVPAATPPADLATRVEEQLARGDRTLPRRRVPLRTRLAAAAAIALLGVGAVWWRTSGRGADTSGPPPSAAVATGPESAPPSPELLENLDLLLDDWETVVNAGEDLDLVVGVDAARALEWLEAGGGRTTPGTEDGG